MFWLFWGRVARGQLFCATYEIFAITAELSQVSNAVEYLNRADIKINISSLYSLNCLWLINFRLSYVYWKILVSYQQNFTMVFSYLRGLVLNN